MKKIVWLHCKWKIVWLSEKIVWLSEKIVWLGEKNSLTKWNSLTIRIGSWKW